MNKQFKKYIVCIWCGGDIPATKSRFQDTKYCSKWCRNFKLAWNGKKRDGTSVHI